MRALSVFTLLLAFTFSSACGRARPPGAEVAAQRQIAGEPVLAFTGGRWFDGESFVERTGYAVEGVLSFVRPGRVDSTIDLAGGFVVPPFGEAHNHNIEHSSRVDRTIARYLRDGVFYVRNPNILPRARAGLAGKVNVPTGIDVVFANGGLTGPGGHPIAHVQRNIQRDVWTPADAEGAFYFVISDEAELDRKWERILAGRPDFLKTYLLHSESYLERLNDPAFVGWTGLDPSLLPEIVRRAHAAGLRVAAHVETAADFHHAVRSGVDEIAHLPGFRGDSAVRIPDPRVYELAEADARRAAQDGIVVVTTVGGVRDMDRTDPDSLRWLAFDRLHARNLRLLLANGVTIAIGSDDYGDTSIGEVMYLHGLGVVDNLALLRMWAEATPRAIFPDRRVGCLRDGCEASFLVLRGDPVEKFARVRDIALRVKEGRVLAIPASE